ncbi:MAG: hypothetical protein U1D55_04890 [Phycisphaerae bacterium]
MRPSADAMLNWACAAGAWRSGRVCALALVALTVSAGCSPGVRWAAFDYGPRVREEGRASGKPTFVYFRSWADVESTHFEDDVLKKPAALQALSDVYCVTLEWAADRDLATRWRVTDSPGYALLAPRAENPLITRSGKVTLEALLADIQNARQGVGAPTTAKP